MEENTQQEISSLKDAAAAIKQAYSIDPEAFALRFTNAGDNIVKELSTFSKQMEEGGSKLSPAFSNFSDDILSSIKAAKKGMDVEGRRDEVDKLRERKAVMAEFAKDGSLTDVELKGLSDTIDGLIKEIKPRAFVSRLQEGGKAAAKEIGSGIEREFNSTVSSLQSGIESLGDEFPPLRIALEKTNQLINFLVSAVYNSAKSAIKKRIERKREANLFRLDSEQKSAPTVSTKKQPIKNTSDKPRKGRQQPGREQAPRPTGTNKPDLVRLDRKSTKAIAKASGNGKGGNRIQQAMANRRGARGPIARGAAPARVGFLARLMPLIMRFLPIILAAGVALMQILGVVTKLGPMIVSAVTGMGRVIGSLVSGAVKSIGPLVTKAVTGAFGKLRGLMGKLFGGGSKASKAASVGSKAVAAGSAAAAAKGSSPAAKGAAAKGGKGWLSKIGKGVKMAGRVASKVALPLMALMAVGEGAYAAYKTEGSLSDKLAAGGKAALSSATMGASDMFFDDADKKAGKSPIQASTVVVQGSTRFIPSNSSLKGPPNNSIVRTPLRETPSNSKKLKDNRPVQAAQMKSIANQQAMNTTKNNNSVKHSSAVINNNTRSSVFVNKTSVDNHNSTFRNASNEGFANG